MEKIKRRVWLKTAVKLGLVSAATTLYGQGNPENSSVSKRGYIVHSVYFWLRDDLSAEDEKLFLGYFELLKKVPGSRSLTYGRAAKTTERDVTDNTFDYNLIILFDSLAQVSIYENHPVHSAGAEKYKQYWKKVQVRDTEIG